MASDRQRHPNSDLTCKAYPATVRRPSVSARPDETFDPVETIAGDEAGGLLLLCDHDAQCAAGGIRHPRSAACGTGASYRLRYRRRIAYPSACRTSRRAGGDDDLLAPADRPEPRRGTTPPSSCAYRTARSFPTTPISARRNASGGSTAITGPITRRWRRRSAACSRRGACRLSSPFIRSRRSGAAGRGPGNVGVLWGQGSAHAGTAAGRARARPGAHRRRQRALCRRALKNDTMYKHGTSRGFAHALIEVRQDLIGDEAGVCGMGRAIGADPLRTQRAGGAARGQALRLHDGRARPVTDFGQERGGHPGAAAGPRVLATCSANTGALTGHIVSGTQAARFSGAGETVPIPSTLQGPSHHG